MLSVPDIELAVIRVLQRIQEESGRPVVSIHTSTKPIGDLPEFDSQNGLEFSCAIEVEFGCSVPLDENLCVDDSGPRQPRTVRGIATRIAEILTVEASV